MPDLLNRVRSALPGRFRVERELGHGGMCTVFLVRDLRHDRPVALKVLRPEIARSVGAERFLREVRIAAQLSHPNILPLYEAGESGGLLWYTMPFVDGTSLRERLDREEQLPIAESVRIAREVADALEHAHQQGVVHRDIKPENIMLAGSHALLADFGVARAAQEAGTGRLTETGSVVGTPIYMSPEQTSGDKRIDARSDIYSLGCVLYEMLAGEPPFAARSALAVMAKKATEPTPHVSVVRETVPESLEKVIQTALARSPADRFRTAADFRDELASPPGRAKSRASSTGRWRAAAAGVASIVVLGAVWWNLGNHFAEGPGISSIAVLPFDNPGGQSQDLYLVEGVRDAISDELARIEGFRVISRTSAMQFKESSASLGEVARALDVEGVVEGSVQRFQDSVRIQVALIRTRPEEAQVWFESITTDGGGVPPTVSEIVRNLSHRLTGGLSPGASTRLGQNQDIDPRAFDAYARGRYEWNQFTDQSLQRAIRYFEEAISVAPDYALAHSALADAYNALPYYAAFSPADALPRAKAAARRAIELDSLLAEAHTALGWTAMVYDWDWVEAERQFTRALDLNPDYSVGRLWYAWFLSFMGRFDEALEQDMLAQESDPLSLRIMQHSAVVWIVAREFDRSIERSQATLERDPGFGRAYLDLGIAYAMAGQYEESVAAFRELLRLAGPDAGGATAPQARLGASLALAGHRAEAMEILAEMEERSRHQYVPALAFAELHLALGNRGRALDFIEEALEVRDGDLFLIDMWATWDPLRDEPRFQRVVDRLGLPNVGDR